MIGDVVNHLWQSTLFALFVGLVAVALRRNEAKVRYALWWAASFKFFLPFSILISIGSHLHWAPFANQIQASVSPVLAPVLVLPSPAIFSTVHAAAHAPLDRVQVVVFGLWVCGAALIVQIRLQGWWRIRRILRRSTASRIPIMATLDFPPRVQVRSSSGLLEPCVAGFFRPVLLLPARLEESLTSSQLEAVLAHEVCHARRGDNITAATHMVIEVLFWFYPLVWWIGARLVEERERACDEYVLQLFQQPRAYAEGILNVCKLYVQAALPCVSGVTRSANMRKRIDAIINQRVGRKLDFRGKAVITLAIVIAVATPFGIGIMTAPLRAQTTADPVCAEADPAIRAAVEEADGKILQVNGITLNKTPEMLAQELVDRYPDDFIVHIRYQQWVRQSMQPSALIDRYQSLAAAHPGNPMFAILYAQALRTTDAPRAIEVLKNVAPSPYDPWLHLTLAESYSSNQSGELPEASHHLDEWFKACPGSLNWNALNGLLFYGSTATMAKQAEALRAKLENDADPHHLLSLQFVWALEFRSRPEAEQAALRQQVALDVARLTSLPALDDNRWPELIASGRKLAADPNTR
jgi:beta-lactamase regulating signal transducer with metallopeptidase domain